MKLKCPDCGHTEPEDDWPEWDVYCPDCGGHGGVKCRNCDKLFDSITRNWPIEVPDGSA